MKLFETVEQGHCCLEAEVTHTPVIHARPNYRACSPVAFGGAEATTAHSKWLQAVSCVSQGWFPAKLSGSTEEKDHDEAKGRASVPGDKEADLRKTL